MTMPQPLNPTPMTEVPLSRAPLVCVLARVSFPPILAIRDLGRVAEFQEKISKLYPNLSESPTLKVAGGQPPHVSQSLVWRFTDQIENARWQVSLGMDFVALQTFRYDSREGFLNRLQTVVSMVEETFNPTLVGRLGLRYIDQLTGEAVNRVNEFLHPQILGITHPSQDSIAAFKASAFHVMTDAQFLAPKGARIQGRWGQLPPNTTYDPGVLEPVDTPTWILDLDMFTTESQPFVNEGLLTTAKDFAQSLYWFFRQIVTEEFLRFYGGEP